MKSKNWTKLLDLFCIRFHYLFVETRFQGPGREFQSIMKRPSPKGVAFMCNPKKA